MSGSAIAAGTLIFGATHAFDVATGTCYRLPKLGRDDRRFGFYQWMDDALLLWSSHKGESVRARPDGVIFSPILDGQP